MNSVLNYIIYIHSKFVCSFATIHFNNFCNVKVMSPNMVKIILPLKTRIYIFTNSLVVGYV